MERKVLLAMLVGLAVTMLSLFSMPTSAKTLFFDDFRDGKLDGLVLYLPLDEGSGDVARDASGNGNDAFIKGKVEWVDGKYGKGLKFDGKNSCAEIPSGFIVDLSATTLATWIKIDELPPAFSSLIIGVTDGPARGIYLELYPVDVSAWNCGPPPISARGRHPALNEWHHLAAVFTESEIRLYFDGEEKAKSPGKNLPNVSGMPFKISGDHPAKADFLGSLKGAVDEVVLYSRALETDEVKEIMEFFPGAIMPKDKLAITWASLKALR